MIKRMVLPGILMGLVVMSARIDAAPSYGTRMPQSRKIIGGVQDYSILKRALEADSGRVQSDQQFFMLSFGVSDWLCLDGKIGTGDIRVRPSGSEKTDYDGAFAGGYGLRVKIYQSEDAKFISVVGFHHISVHPYSVKSNGIHHRAILDDWQFSLLGSVRIRTMTPYAGVRWSRVDYIHWIEEDRKRTMSDLTRSVGAVLGLDIPLGRDTVFLNIESHFIDETSVSCALMWQF